MPRSGNSSKKTGLVVSAGELVEFGVHSYLRGKDLALFAWTPHRLPDPRNLACTSRFTLADGTSLPEFDRFGLFPWEEALSRVGKNLARILVSIRKAAGWG